MYLNGSNDGLDAAYMDLIGSCIYILCMKITLIFEKLLWRRNREVPHVSAPGSKGVGKEDSKHFQTMHIQTTVWLY